jgi:hypothetical protein
MIVGDLAATAFGEIDIYKERGLMLSKIATWRKETPVKWYFLPLRESPFDLRTARSDALLKRSH